MISYLYRLDYDDQACASDGTDRVTTGGPLIINAYIYALADKYEITVLKEVAKEKTIVAIETKWKKECFLVAIHNVWTTTPSSDRGLRRCYISIIAKHRTDLRAREDFLGVLSLHGDLAVDILKVTWGMIARAQSRTLRCDQCGYKMTPQCYLVAAQATVMSWSLMTIYRTQARDMTLGCGRADSFVE